MSFSKIFSFLKKWFLWILAAKLTLSLVLYFTWWRPRKQRRERQQVAASSAEARAGWDWSRYECVDRFLIGQMRAEVAPAHMIRYSAVSNGSITLYTKTREAFTPKNTLFAAFDQQQLQAEKRNIEIAQQTLELEERWALTMERPQQRLKAEKEVDEAKRKLELLRLVMEDPDLKALTAEFGDGNVDAADALTLARAQEEFSILEAQLAAIKGEGLGTFDLKLESKRLEFENRKAEFERKCERANSKTDFDGFLQISHSFSLNDEVDVYQVSQGQEIATLRDLSQLQLVVTISHPAWLQLPKERLEAIVYNAQGKAFTAPYCDHRVEQRGSTEVRHYCFMLPQEDAEQARALMGSSPQVDLWFTPEAPVYKVPKTDVALHARGLASGRRWDEIVRSLWPGAQLVAEGQLHLAIVPPAARDQPLDP